MESNKLKPGMMAVCLPGFDLFNPGQGYKPGAIFRIRDWNGIDEFIETKYGPVKVEACRQAKQKEIDKYVYQRKIESGELEKVPSIERKMKKKSTDFFYFRKANYQVFKSEKLPVIKVKSYIDNVKNITDQIMIMGNIFKKENIVFLTEEEYEQLLHVWNNLTIKETVDGASIYSCMRYDNKELKMKYSNVEELKALLFLRVMTQPDKNFEAYKCAHCHHYHIGKNGQEVYKRNLLHKIFYFIDVLRYKKKVKNWVSNS